MAHFYGTIDGSAKTQTSRQGTKNSGLHVKAASYAGAVEIDLSFRDGVDWCEIRFALHQGSGVSRVIYDGPINAETQVDALVKAAELQSTMTHEDILKTPRRKITRSVA